MVTEKMYDKLAELVVKKGVNVQKDQPVIINSSVQNVSFVRKVARYAVDKMFKKKLIIIPGTRMKITTFFNRFVSNKMALKVVYKFQKKKGSK